MTDIIRNFAHSRIVQAPTQLLLGAALNLAGLGIAVAHLV